MPQMLVDDVTAGQLNYQFHPDYQEEKREYARWSKLSADEKFAETDARWKALKLVTRGPDETRAMFELKVKRKQQEILREAAKEN